MMDRAASRQAGFALIVALLALVLLTFLGMTLTLSTTTEMQAAVNYRWSQQALYNAEAGIEVAKRYLRQVDWPMVVLPQPRTAAEMGAPPTGLPFPIRVGPYGEPNRSFENVACDAQGNEGFGIILDDPTYPFPLQNMSNFLLDAGGAPLSIPGAFTVWIRRPLQADDAGAYRDNPDGNLLVLTAEGIAPFAGASGVSAFGRANRAVRFLEVTLQRVLPGDCENRSGQAGGGPGGANYDQCDPVNASTILGGAVEPDATAR